MPVTVDKVAVVPEEVLDQMVLELLELQTVAVAAVVQTVTEVVAGTLVVLVELVLLSSNTKITS